MFKRNYDQFSQTVLDNLDQIENTDHLMEEDENTDHLMEELDNIDNFDSENISQYKRQRFMKPEDEEIFFALREEPIEVVEKILAVTLPSAVALRKEPAVFSSFASTIIRTSKSYSPQVVLTASSKNIPSFYDQKHQPRVYAALGQVGSNKARQDLLINDKPGRLDIKSVIQHKDITARKCMLARIVHYQNRQRQKKGMLVLLIIMMALTLTSNAIYDVGARIFYR